MKKKEIKKNFNKWLKILEKAADELECLEPRFKHLPKHERRRIYKKFAPIDTTVRSTFICIQEGDSDYFENEDKSESGTTKQFTVSDDLPSTVFKHMFSPLSGVFEPINEFPETIDE